MHFQANYMRNTLSDRQYNTNYVTTLSFVRLRILQKKKQETNLYHIHNNTCQTDGRTNGRMNEGNCSVFIKMLYF